MLDTSYTPSWLFHLEGTVVGFLDETSPSGLNSPQNCSRSRSARKPKAIVLDVEQEQLAIKLPKDLRSSLHQTLQPGDRVRCIGCSQLDPKTHVIKLKAYQFMDIQSAPDSVPPSPAIPATPYSPQKRAKIQICRKSGCQKRGGRQMVAALEQLLHDHQLQDRVEIQYTGCQDRCSKAPNLTIMPGRHQYNRLSLNSLAQVIKSHFI